MKDQEMLMEAMYVHNVANRRPTSRYKHNKDKLFQRQTKTQTNKQHETEARYLKTDGQTERQRKQPYILIS